MPEITDDLREAYAAIWDAAERAADPHRHSIHLIETMRDTALDALGLTEADYHCEGCNMPLWEGRDKFVHHSSEHDGFTFCMNCAPTPKDIAEMQPEPSHAE